MQRAEELPHAAAGRPDSSPENLLTCTTSIQRQHWHRPSTHGNASHTFPAALQEAPCTSRLPRSRWATARWSAPGTTSNRIRQPPVESPPCQTPGRSQSESEAASDRPNCGLTIEAFHAEGCRGPRWQGTPRRDHLRLPKHQDQPDHLLAAGAAKRTNCNYQGRE